jgi:hypothetical protein
MRTCLKEFSLPQKIALPEQSTSPTRVAETAHLTMRKGSFTSASQPVVVRKNAKETRAKEERDEPEKQEEDWRGLKRSHCDNVWAAGRRQRSDQAATGKRL